MDSKTLREKYIEFFKNKGHAEIPSSPLVPENDPTTLFISAGMQPLVPYLLGEHHPAGKRLVNVQKCLRTGDIDEVGDATHMTFFEMLGNWSLGDPASPDGIGQGGYWKEEAITFSFEFLTKELKLSIDKLAVSVFAGDEDAPKDEQSVKIWESLGIPKNRIFPLGKKDNWWGPVGSTGPCGPDTEMFYWVGKEQVENSPDTDNRWVEIWNDVFMEYNKTAEDKFEQLAQKNVDTGMGLERMLAVLQQKENVFETDALSDLYQSVQDLMVTSEVKLARVISDHIRAAVFLIASGVVPSNVERGYILRRLIRRAVRSAHRSGIKQGFAKQLAKIVVGKYSLIYSDLKDKEEEIYQVLESEEEKFRKPINWVEQYRQDLEAAAIKGTVKKIGQTFILKEKGVASGRYVFENYQTYGVPPDLAEDVTQELQLTYDKEGFEQALKEHQDKSRSAAVGMFAGGLAEKGEETTKLHTATHLLHQALRIILGKSVKQAGSNITQERLRFDFTHPQALIEEEKQKVEQLVNQKIRQDLPVSFQTMTLDQAKKMGALAFFGQKYGDVVRVYSIGEYSKEVCGGPHVEHTGVLGTFKIIKEESVSAGVRRIYAGIL